MRKIFILFAGALLCAGVAGAQPPPASESSCDAEEGAAYGLCTAFCDAMDCETDNPQASATACDKVKGKYQQVTGHEPPCLQSQCVCNEALPGFLAAVNSTIVACFEFIDSVELVTSDNLLPGGFAFNGIGACGFNSGDFLSITEEEGLACKDFLRARAAAAGVTCTTGGND